MSMPEDAGRLWEMAQHSGMSRRKFLVLMAAGGAAAVLAGCTDIGSAGDAGAVVEPEAEALPWFKDPAPFIQHEKSLEARLESIQGTITPNDLFFVRNNSVSVDIDVDEWRLVVEGDAASNPVSLSYEEIRGLPSRTVVAYLECGGNHRAMFDILQGRKADGTQWGTGGIGNAEWTGVAMSDVLAEAGASPDAVSVMLVGQDVDSPEDGFRRAIPMEKAMRQDTILAYAMNGEALPRDHGYPLRALVPGWVGSSSIKWLSRIIVSSEQLWGRNNTSSYVLIGDAYPPEGEAHGKVVTAQSIKSALALPWPAEVGTGRQRLHGFAHSPAGPITRVEWSADSGESWSDAQVLEPQVQRSWARFEFAWDAEGGDHIVMTRATDSEGNTQPDNVPFNEKGYLFNQPLPHPIKAG